MRTQLTGKSEGAQGCLTMAECCAVVVYVASGGGGAGARGRVEQVGV